MQTAGPTLVLASASPRRRDMLSLAGVRFTVIPAAIDETPHPGEAPADYVRRVARDKAAAVRAQAPAGSVVLAADTAVCIDDELFGKPRDAADARRMLARLSGREHRVLSAVCVEGGSGARAESLVETRVRFRPLDDPTIAAYVASGEPLDKAGAYGIQGLGGALVSTIDGSYSAVVGLPLAETLALLEAAGISHALAGSQAHA